MKQRTTDRLLTLGMALTSDRRTMERRVRGVFARKKSAKVAMVLSLTLVLALAAGGFTTACRPGKSADNTQADRFAGISTDLPRQTHAPEIKSISFLNNEWWDTQDVLDSLQEAPFTPLSAPAGFQEPRTRIAENVYLTVDADVVIPEAEGYGVRRVEDATFTAEQYQKLADYFLKGAFVSETMARDGFSLPSERDGVGYAASGTYQSHIFLFGPTTGGIIREGFLPGDAELEADYGPEIQKPISLLREDAQAVAEQTLSDLGITGLMLDSAERACWFGEWNGEEIPVLSRGWDFVFVTNDAGLPLHYYNGGSTSGNDTLNYCSLLSGSLSIYIDDSGVSNFYWLKDYEPAETLYQNVAILSAEDALALAKERLAKMYPQPLSGFDGARLEIELYAVRLSASLIAYSKDARMDGYITDPVAEGLLVPCWDVSFQITDTGDGYVTYETLPFVAFDGGTVHPLG